MALQKEKKKGISSAALIFASLVWGISFAVQSVGGKILGAFTYNGVRLLIGALVLFLVIQITDRTGLSRKPETKEEKRLQFTTGLFCGLFIFVATNLQQVAINLGAAAGKAGFLTAMYILMVPLIGLIFRQKCGWNVWVAITLSLGGLYLLCVRGDFIFSLPDILLLLCALGFSCQIILVDRRGGQVDSLRLSGMQFLTAGLLTMVFAVIFEIVPYPGGLAAWTGLFKSGSLWIGLLYMGIFSCGVGYTLQIVGQKGLEPSVAAVLMSLESVFSVLAGWLLLHEQLSARELTGCLLIFAAVILAQIRFRQNQQTAQ